MHVQQFECGFCLYPHWLLAHQADALLPQLAQLPWQQDSVTLFGKSHRIPRQHLWLSQQGQTYCYSGLTMRSAGWPGWIAHLAEGINRQLGTRFNSALANCYRHGADKMGWHSDDEPELGNNPQIAIVSIGTARYLGVRRKGYSKMQDKIALAHGSLLHMPAGSQAIWQHALLAQSQKRVATVRYSLTFRHILAGEPVY